MSAPRCTKTPGVACVRVRGHKGVCSACPSACTLDWDQHYTEAQEKHLHRAAVLASLDFPTPPWADLLD